MSSPIDLLIGLGQNIALALTLCFIEEHLVVSHSRLSNRGRQLCMGLLFAGMAMISMQLPLAISPGVTIDTRVVLVALAGAFYGLPAALAAASTVAAYRLHLGGAGALAGTAAVLQGGLLGTFLFRWVGGRVTRIGYLHLLLFGISIAAGSLLCCFLLPRDLIWKSLQAFGAVVMLAYPIATLAIGSLIMMAQRNHANQQELRESRDRMTLATSTANLGVWDWDIVHDTLVWDDGMFRVFGISRSGFAGAYAAWAHCLHPEDRQRAEDELTRCLAEGREYETTFRIIRMDGAIRTIRTTSKTFHGADGKPLRMVGINEDISRQTENARELERHRNRLEELVAERTVELERMRYEAESARAQAVSALDEAKRMESSYIASKESAERANSAKSRFLSSMSHEIRTPLNAILGYAQMLGRSSTLPDEHRRAVTVINRSGEHLLQLINDILELSRIEAERASLTEEDFDLPALIDNLHSLFLQRALDKGLDLRVVLARDLPRFIRTDQLKLRQILGNLLANGVKFTERGAVEISVGVDDGRLVASVRDSGPGMNDEDRRRLFEPFFQAGQNRRKGEGTGLGLAISMGFARLLGGELTVQSAAGHGSTFTLDIPVKIVPTAQTAHRQRRIVGLAPGQRAPRLLVAEDHADSRDLLVELLRSTGCEVEAVGDGAAAVAACRRSPPDLVWMDIDMPILDGLAATAAIRALPGPKPVIVALTAAAFVEDRARILAAGCADVASKPFAEEVPFLTMERLLGTVFLWREPISDTPPGAALASDRELHGALQGVPEQDRKALAAAAITGDLDACHRLLAAWPNRPLAGMLSGLLSDFAFERVELLLGSPAGAAERPKTGAGHPRSRT